MPRARAESRHRMASKTLPDHIGIILDGNGRWASERGLTRREGHEHGAAAVRVAVRGARDRGIRVLTLYAFSVNNWSRPDDEIDALMRISAEFAERERDDLAATNVHVRVAGDLDGVPERTRRAVEDLCAATARNTGMTLVLALNYGGRRDLASAVRALAIRAQHGALAPEDIDEAMIRGMLATADLPDPDLIIRTGGERRLSDFLLFECAYAELFFTETRWPDFSEQTLDDALRSFARRQRRFGKVIPRAEITA